MQFSKRWITSDLLRALFADSLIIAFDMNQIFVSMGLAKFYFEIPGSFSQILHVSAILDIHMMLGVRRQTLNWDSLWTRRLQFVRMFKSGGRHIDIGAGDGTFLRKTKEAGFSVIGTEWAVWIRCGLIRYTGIDWKLGQFTEINLPEVKYDLIALWHILEHLPYPGVMMSRIRKIIAPDGILVVAVPNEDHPIWRNRLIHWNHRTPFEPLRFGSEIHLTHFQPRTLKRLLRLHQFRIVYFGEDDFYDNRSSLKRLKIICYEALARLTGWHPAVAMVAARRQFGNIKWII